MVGVDLKTTRVAVDGCLVLALLELVVSLSQTPLQNKTRLLVMAGVVDEQRGNNPAIYSPPPFPAGPCARAAWSRAECRPAFVPGGELRMMVSRAESMTEPDCSH